MIYSKENVSDSIAYIGKNGLFSHTEDFKESTQGKLTRIVICEDKVLYECNYADKNFVILNILKNYKYL